MFSGATTKFIMNWKVKHPEKNAVVINYDIVTVMLPCVLLGALVGVQINTILPMATITIILSVAVLFLFIITIKKAVSIYRLESQRKIEQAQKA